MNLRIVGDRCAVASVAQSAIGHSHSPQQAVAAYGQQGILGAGRGHGAPAAYMLGRIALIKEYSQHHITAPRNQGKSYRADVSQGHPVVPGPGPHAHRKRGEGNPSRHQQKQPREAVCP